MCSLSRPSDLGTKPPRVAVEHAKPSTMHAHRTAALLVLVTVLVAGTGVAAATDAPPAVRAENTTIDYSGDAVTLVTESDATVSGETALDPGTELSVTLRSSNSEQPFLLSNDTTVREDGRFVAGFDLADTADGVNATLVVRSDGEELARVAARLVAEPTPTPTESPTPDPTGVPTDSPAQSTRSSADGSGFGALVALLAALGTAVALGRRT